MVEVPRGLDRGHGDEPDSRILERRNRLGEHLPDALVDPPHASAGRHQLALVVEGRRCCAHAREGRTPARRSSAPPRRGADRLRSTRASTQARVSRVRCQVSWWSTSAIEHPIRFASCCLDRAKVHALLLERARLAEMELEREDANEAGGHVRIPCRRRSSRLATVDEMMRGASRIAVVVLVACLGLVTGSVACGGATASADVGRTSATRLQSAPTRISPDLLPGWTLTASASVGRRSDEGLVALQQLATPLPRVVVVSLGTNDNPADVRGLHRNRPRDSQAGRTSSLHRLDDDLPPRRSGRLIRRVQPRPAQRGATLEHASRSSTGQRWWPGTPRSSAPIASTVSPRGTARGPRRPPASPSAARRSIGHPRTRERHHSPG